MRIGFASDIHRLVPERKLILAGVHVPYDLGEEAHSDGDVVYHAVAESILGALALGDLGKHFPDTDLRYKDMHSSIIMKHVVSLMEEEGYEIGNVDISITLQRPKIASFIEDMRLNIARLLNTETRNVSLKAGTNEGLDAIGQGMAVKAESIVLLKEKE